VAAVSIVVHVSAAGVLAVAALTPGPNNLIVLRAAAAGGVRGALPAIAGIVLGSLALAGAALAGIGPALTAHPRWRTAVTIGGCAYLCLLGISLFLPKADASAQARAPSFAGLFGFQFLNPKAWVMVLTLTSAVDSAGLVAALFAAIPTVCLLLWASMGALISGALRRPRFGAWFDRTMGALLVLFALLLAAEA